LNVKCLSTFLVVSYSLKQYLTYSMRVHVFVRVWFVGYTCVNEIVLHVLNNVLLYVPPPPNKQVHFWILLTSLLRQINLWKGKVLWQHSLNGEIAALVLLKLFINGNEKCHSIGATSAWTALFVLYCKQHTSHDTKGSEM